MEEIEAGRVGAEEKSGGGTQRGATGTPGKGRGIIWRGILQGTYGEWESGDVQVGRVTQGMVGR